MGSVGDAYYNAMCESFFATLECELLVCTDQSGLLRWAERLDLRIGVDASHGLASLEARRGLLLDQDRIQVRCGIETHECHRFAKEAFMIGTWPSTIADLIIVRLARGAATGCH